MHSNEFLNPIDISYIANNKKPRKKKRSLFHVVCCVAYLAC